MRVVAYMCDKCSRMHPGERPPPDWFNITINVNKQGTQSGTWLFCSERCVSRWFLGLSKENRNEGGEGREDMVVSQEEDFSSYSCPHCSWTPGSRRTGSKSRPLTDPSASLRMHISRTHGKLTGAPSRKKAS